jgi:hypothetical protein
VQNKIIVIAKRRRGRKAHYKCEYAKVTGYSDFLFGYHIL